MLAHFAIIFETSTYIKKTWTSSATLVCEGKQVKNDVNVNRCEEVKLKRHKDLNVLVKVLNMHPEIYEPQP